MIRNDLATNQPHRCSDLEPAEMCTACLLHHAAVEVQVSAGYSPAQAEHIVNGFEGRLADLRVVR